MIKISGLTSDPSQTFNIAEPTTGEKVYFTLTYRPRTQNWYMDIAFKNFIEKGAKIVRGPNIYNRHKNQVPFGIGVTVSDNFEPFLINDFSSGRVSLYLLTSEEVDEIDAAIKIGATVP